MRFVTLFSLLLLSPILYSEEIQQLSKDVIKIIEKMPGGDPLLESEGKFYLTRSQADQLLSYSKVNQDIALLQNGEGQAQNGKFCPAPIVESNSSQAIAPHVGILLLATSTAPATSTGTVFANTPISLPEQVYTQLFQTPADWKNILVANKDKLTSDQKIELISKLGTYFSNGYNYARAEDKNAKGFVSAEQLLVAVQKGKPGGICRDIALAQTQMLELLGFKDNYVLSYKSFSGHHVTVVSVDPETGKIVKFNYGEVSSAAKGSGTQVLDQDTVLPDFGIKYNVYDTKGKPVVQLPSELGQMLKETTGGIDREFNSKNYNLGKISFEKNGIHGNLFTGQTSSGETVSGVALYVNKETEYLKTHVGVAASSTRGEKKVTSISADNLYLNAGGEARTGTLQLGPAAVRGVIGSEVGLLRSDVSQRNRTNGLLLEGKGEIDASIEGFLGLQTEVKLKDGKTVIENQTYINVYPGFSNVASADHTTLATNSVVVDTKLTHQFSDGDKSALARSVVIFRNYGSSVVLEAGYQDKASGSRYVAGVSAPLTSQPSFLPGGTSSAYVRGEKEILNGLVFGVELEQNSSHQTSARVGVEGKFD